MRLVRLLGVGLAVSTASCNRLRRRDLAVLLDVLWAPQTCESGPVAMWLLQGVGIAPRDHVSITSLKASALD